MKVNKVYQCNVCGLMFEETSQEVSCSKCKSQDVQHIPDERPVYSGNQERRIEMAEFNKGDKVRVKGLDQETVVEAYGTGFVPPVLCKDDKFYFENELEKIGK